MSEAVVSVRAAGPLTSIQDAGRIGFLRYGVPASGPMDRLAFAAANAALGNPPGTPCIEASLGGVALDVFIGKVTVAVAGGGFILDQGARRSGSWSIVTIESGQSLTIRPGPWGTWCYLAFAGQLQGRSWLGSVATHARSNFGAGRVAADQQLIIADARSCPDLDGPIPCPLLARPRRELRVVIGPQDHLCGLDHVETLLSETWSFTDAYDRMGVRLKGPEIVPAAALDMPSEAVVRGSVQIAGDGKATVLLADHQTTGGYPKIATILDCDLDAFVQLRPHDRIVFRAVSPDRAIALARAHAVRVETWLARLAGRRLRA